MVVMTSLSQSNEYKIEHLFTGCCSLLKEENIMVPIVLSHIYCIVLGVKVNIPTNEETYFTINK